MINFKNFLNLIVLTIFVGLNLSAESKDQNEKIKIGFLYPASGILSEYGVAVYNGLQMAMDENPEEFKNIKIIYEDQQWDSKVAVNAYMKLVNSDKVNLIFNWGNPTTDALAPIAKNQKQAMVAMSSSYLVNENNDYLFRSLNTAENISISLAEYLNKQNQGPSAILVAQNSYVAGLFNGLKNNLNKPFDIVEEFPLDQMDFRSMIAKLRAKKIKTLGIFLITGQVSTFYRQLGANHNFQTFGADFFDSQNEIDQSMPAINGAVYPTFAVSDEFRERYLKKYRNDLQIVFAGNTYDTMLAVAKALKDQKSTIKGKELIDLIKQLPDQNGVSGEFKVNLASPHFEFPVVLKKVVNGRVEVIE